MMNLSAESWCATQSARVIVGVEASVSGSGAGSARAEMMKAVDEVAEADWRLTNFNRTQDQTGMERWSAQFEARLPEKHLSGLSETAKKHSRPGMQLRIENIDFTPTLAETQNATNKLREELYKAANEQLAALNATIAGRNFRIALINFTNMPDRPTAAPMMMRANAMAANKMMTMAGNADESEGAGAMERAEKLTLTAHVVFAAEPEAKPAK